MPREVRYIFEDFACTSPIQGFANDISLFRSAGLSAIMLLQSEYQLEAIYKDEASVIRQWTSQLEQFKNAYPEAFDKNVHTPPAGHFGDAELEIGRVCVQLASPDFKYMTGETLTLEGGLGQRP